MTPEEALLKIKKINMLYLAEITEATTEPAETSESVNSTWKEKEQAIKDKYSGGGGISGSYDDTNLNLQSGN